MNEQHFIAAMQRALRALPAAQRENILSDYRAHFAEAREQGKTDEETALSLGDPRTIARSFLAHFHIQQIEQPPAGQQVHTVFYHIMRAILLLCTILLFNFIFMLWPVILVAMVLVAFWFALIALVLSAGIFAIALASGAFKALVITSLYAKLTLIFYSLAAAGGGILMIGVLTFVSRVFLLSLFQYLQANIKMIKPRS